MNVKNFRRILQCLALVCTLVLSLQSQPASARPNIILITTDNQGVGDICYDLNSHQTDTDNPGLLRNSKLCDNISLKTPNIDQLAREGVILNNFYSVSPLCTPSRAALMTGRDPQRVGALDALANTSYVPAEEKTIAELLRDAGYDTAIVGKWNLGFKEGLYSWNQGFDYNYMMTVGVHYGHTGFCLAEKLTSLATPTWHYINGVKVGTGSVDQWVDINTWLVSSGGGTNDCKPTTAGGTATEQSFSNFLLNTESSGTVSLSLTEKLQQMAVRYIQNVGNVRTPGKPFFLYVALPSPHSPQYIHIPQYATISDPEISGGTATTPLNIAKWCNDTKCLHMGSDRISCVNNCELAKLYHYSVHEIDNNVGTILSKITDTSNTIVVFTSDNGPYNGFYAEYNNPERTYTHDRSGSAGGLRGGQQFTYEAGVRVPFIVRYDTGGAYKYGDRNGDTYNRLNQIVDNMDLLPTLLREALKNSGRCTDNAEASDCVINANMPNNNSKIVFSGYEIAIDGKDMSSVLSGMTTSTPKNEHISFRSFEKTLCKTYTGTDFSFWPPPKNDAFDTCGYCATDSYGNDPLISTGTAESSWEYGIRSNKTFTGGPSNIDNYKLYFNYIGANGPAGTPQELFNLAANRGEVENGSGNLCMTADTNKCTPSNGCNLCLDCNLISGATYSCPSLPTTPVNLQLIVQKLWERSNYYHKKSYDTTKICDTDVLGDNLFPNGCPCGLSTGCNDTTPPIAGSPTAQPESNGYVPASFTVTTPFSEDVSLITSCDYTTNGTTWLAGVVSATTPTTCTASLTGQAGQSKTVTMRATSAGGTTTAGSITKTVDATPPTDGSTKITVIPGNGLNSLSWLGASDSGSGLRAADRYEVRYQTGGTAPANCSAGTRAYIGMNTAFVHSPLTNGTQYSYRVCAYDVFSNVSTGATGSGTPAAPGIATLDSWTSLYSGSPLVSSATNTVVGSFAVSGGTNRLLMVAIVLETGSNSRPSISSVKYGSATLTQINITTTSQKEHVWMGYLKNASIGSGTNTLTISYSGMTGNLTGLHVKWGSYSNVNQTTPVNASVKNNPASTTVSFNSSLAYVAGGRTIVVSGNGGAPVASAMNNTAFGLVGSHVTSHNHSSAVYETSNHASAGSFAKTTAASWGSGATAWSALVAAEIKP